jgi:hypothetical protein
MNKLERLQQVSKKIEEISLLISGNEFENYLNYHLVLAKLEVQRQLTKLENPSKMEK